MMTYPEEFEKNPSLTPQEIKEWMGDFWTQYEEKVRMLIRDNHNNDFESWNKEPSEKYYMNLSFAEFIELLNQEFTDIGIYEQELKSIS